MPLSRIVSRLGAVSVGAVLVAGSIAGCTPEEPEPTPTVLTFASEEEAYGAAEEVYRAYNDEINAQRSGNAGANPDAYLIGVALQDSFDAEREFNELGVSLVGTALIESFEPKKADLESVPKVLEAVVCIDVRGVRLVDGGGADITPSSRGDVVDLLVTFVVTSDGPRISESRLPEGGSEC